MATRIGEVLGGASTTPPVNSISASTCKEKRQLLSLPPWLLRQAREDSLPPSRRSKRVGTFGARPCRAVRERILKEGWAALPKSWQRKWMVQRILATPPWADFTKIRKVYEEAARLGWTVGHQIPLNHPRVCGLHVAENLIPEPAKLNFSKGNAWCEWHGDLFAEPEQLKLF